MRAKLFVIAWVIVAAVSAFDAYLAVLYAEHLHDMERNPVGQALISAGGVAAFVGVKFFGTSVALGILLGLRRHWTALPVALGMSSLQLSLLCYLVLS